MLKPFIEVMQEYHPCRKEVSETVSMPDCLESDSGLCAEYPGALYCPKYGVPIGSVKNHWDLMMEVEE